MAIPSRASPRTTGHVFLRTLKTASDILPTSSQVSVPLRPVAAGRICAQTSNHSLGVGELRTCVGFQFRPGAGLPLLAASDASPRSQDRSFACNLAMSDATAASRDWEEPNSVPVCEFTREAHDGDMLVGTVIGQIYKKDDGMYLYVKSLEVHPDYRRQQVGSLLMKACIRVGVEEYNIVEAYLHVPTNESGVIKFFYRCGFKIKKRVENYNVQTDFPDCFLLTKRDGIWWDTSDDADIPFVPENVNLELIEPATVIAEFEKQAQWPGEPPVGSITCQVIRTADLWYHLYIKSLVVGEAHRRQAFGSMLLKICTDFATTKFRVVEAFAYVPCNDYGAMSFCEKNGFVKKKRIDNFFKWSPDTPYPDCFVYTKELLSKD